MGVLPSARIVLPIRPSEAAVLAELIFEQAEGRPLTGEIRQCLERSVAALGLTSVRPCFGSLEREPEHASAYFVAVDGLSSGCEEPLLLHLAPAAEPGDLPHGLLIGRMRPGGGREIAIYSSPFGPTDDGQIAAFVESAGRCFLPRPQGAAAALRVELTEPAGVAQAALQAFSEVSGASGCRRLAILLPGRAECFWAMVWAAIRAGYRDAYTAGGAFSPEVAKLFTFFPASVDDVEALVETLRPLRDGAAYDLEIDPRTTPVAAALGSPSRRT